MAMEMKALANSGTSMLHDEDTIIRRKSGRLVQPPDADSVDRLSIDLHTVKRVVARMRHTKYPGLEVNAESMHIIGREATSLLKKLIQESSKFAEMAFRKNMRPDDVNRAVKMLGHEHLFGLGIPKEIVPQLHQEGKGVAVDSGEQVTLMDAMSEFSSAKEMPLSAVVHSRLINKCSRQEPGVSEGNSNPDTCTNHNSKQDLQRFLGRPIQFKKNEIIHLRVRHLGPLTQELEQYFTDIVTTCINGPKEQRQLALQSIRYDPNLVFMYRQMSLWIMKKTDQFTRNLSIESLLILMCMTKNLILNEAIKKECIMKVLHELLPSVLTCIVTRTTTYAPNGAKHGVLRKFSAELLKLICDRYSNDVNKIHSRVTKVLKDGLQNSELDLVSVYGCLVGMYTVNEGEMDVENTPIPKKVFEKFGSALSFIQRRDVSKTVVK